MRKKSQENNFVLKFVRYEAMSMPVVYSPPVIPADFRIGHRFPKSLMPPPPPPSVPTTETSTNEPPKQKSMQLDANTRGLLLGDLSFLSRPPPNMTVPPPSLPPPPTPTPPPPPPAPPKEEIIPVKPTTAPSLEWDVEKERSSHTTSTSTGSARSHFLDAVRNRFTPSSDREHLTEQQSMEAALQVKKSSFIIIIDSIL
jgi:hypothetical protein